MTLSGPARGGRSGWRAKQNKRRCFQRRVLFTPSLNVTHGALCTSSDASGQDFLNYTKQVLHQQRKHGDYWNVEAKVNHTPHLNKLDFLIQWLLLLMSSFFHYMLYNSN